VNGVGCFLRLDAPDFGDETEAVFFDCFNKLPFSGLFAQRSPKGVDAFVQIVFFDERFSPNSIKQFVFRNQMPVVSHQNAERFKSLFGKRHALTVSGTHQKSFRHIKPKLAKLKYFSVPFRHTQFTESQ
jgi:hypothetical protein